MASDLSIGRQIAELGTVWRKVAEPRGTIRAK